MAQKGSLRVRRISGVRRIPMCHQRHSFTVSMLFPRLRRRQPLLRQIRPGLCELNFQQKTIHMSLILPLKQKSYEYLFKINGWDVRLLIAQGGQFPDEYSRLWGSVQGDGYPGTVPLRTVTYGNQRQPKPSVFGSLSPIPYPLYPISYILSPIFSSSASLSISSGFHLRDQCEFLCSEHYLNFEL